MIIALRTMLLCALLYLVTIWSPVTSSTVVASSDLRSTIPRGNKTAHNCLASCGNLSFAYPFGVGPECYRGPDFRLTCDDVTWPPKLFLRDNITEVINSIVVSFDGNYYGPQNYIHTSIWRTIPMISGIRVYNLTLELPGRSFSRFYTVLNITGCDLHVYMVSHMKERTTWICSISCPGTEITEMAARENCNGVGCCQVQHALWDVLQLSFVKTNTESNVGTNLRFNQTSLLRERITVSSDGAAMLTWTFVDQPNCLATSVNQSNYACKSKYSSCYDYGMTSSNGYICQCGRGYTGNPYILDGCAKDKEYNPKQIRAACTRQCGNVSVQFPFGIEDGCFARKHFHLECTNATSSAALKLEHFQVIDLNVNEGTIQYTDPHQQDQIDADYPFTYGRSLFLADNAVMSSQLRWVAANLSCAEATQNLSGYACVSMNSECVEVNCFAFYVGYRCKCLDGFEGNPYIQNGCEDINECLEHNICNGSVCHNREAGFSCTKCPPQTEYDPSTNQCARRHQQVLLVGIVIGLSGGFIILLLSFIAIYFVRGWQTNVQLKLRRNYFRKNEGLLLEQLSSDKTNIFSLEELEKATNNFDSTRIIGCGGHGMVYKGILSDQSIVAIKKSKVIEYNEIKQFINEVAVLSQINHRNIVKLLGCCLETEVPLLVYDYIPNGSLCQVLHSYSRNDYTLSWDDYLRIAMETAGALSYLHSSASISIFHRDVKSTNILLDGNYTAKVSDFGASRLVPLDQTHIVTNIQGTLGYLDPEYFHTRKFTEKSDVYSFGVVLLELLIREKPVFRNKSGVEQNLSNYFLQALRANENINDIVHPQVLGKATQVEIRKIASLAEICLRLRGEERPTMKQVEMELQILRNKPIYSCQNNLESEQQMAAICINRRVQPPRQSFSIEYGARVHAPNNNSKRCYSLEEEMMQSATLPR